jgi:glycosyltransferase involved in cell wall biosynthesis
MSEGLNIKKQIKLALVYPTDPYIEVMGGMTRYMRHILRQSLKRGAKVKFIGVKLGKKELNYDSDFIFIPIVNGSDTWWKYLLVSFFRVPFMKFEVDEIIHSGRLLFLLPYILFHPKNPKVLTSDRPRLAAYLAYPKPIYYILSAIYTPIENFMIKRVQAVIAADHVLMNYWRKRYPHLSHKFKERIYPAVGVDLDFFRPSNKFEARTLLNINPASKVILFVGRVSKIKGIDFLIDAFTEFCKNEPDALFIIVGRGEDEEKLKNYAYGKPTKERILFLGEKRGRELVNIYNCADVLVIGSHAEGNSGVLREALACGIPVVSMDVGDAKDIINSPLLGRVVTERNPKKFSNAISELMLQDKETMRKVCRKRSYEFSEEAVFETIYNLYASFYTDPHIDWTRQRCRG